MLARLDDSGKIQSYSYDFTETDYTFNGLKEDKENKKDGIVLFCSKI